MTFEGANRKLGRIGKGMYRSLVYDLTTDTDGKRTAECRLYLDTGTGKPSHLVGAPTWDGAFRKLAEAMERSRRRQGLPARADRPPRAEA